MFPKRFIVWLAAVLLGFTSLLAQADPPARVGRVSVVEGPVTFRTDRQDGGAVASVNWPVSSGALLDTDRGARVEVWVGAAAIRLGSESRLEFGALDDHLVALQLAAGSLSLSVQDREQANELEVTTPNGRVQFNGPGRYRIDVGQGRTNVSVHAGSAYVYGADRSTSVAAGRAAVIDGSGGLTLYSELLRDGFDDWAAGRDADSPTRAATRYVSPQMTGYQDLDGYGDWSAVPDYGPIWYPRAVPLGWAPYRQGRWAWVEPWGWTWIDAAPWGFAPFHYGRWVAIRGRWGWVPGTYVARPVYAPALVGWIGNPGWSIGFSAGSAPAVGWFPLAPREVFVPAYRTSPTYVRQVNVTHVTNVTVIDRVVADRGEHRFVHRDRPEAVTIVPSSTLREGRPITAAALQRPSLRDLQQAPVSARAPDAAWVAPLTGDRHPNDGRRWPLTVERREAERVPPSVAPAPASSAGTAPASTASRQPAPLAARPPVADTPREAAPRSVENPRSERDSRFAAPPPSIRSPVPAERAMAAPIPAEAQPRQGAEVRLDGRELRPAPLLRREEGAVTAPLPARDWREERRLPAPEARSGMPLDRRLERPSEPASPREMSVPNASPATQPAMREAPRMERPPVAEQRPIQPVERRVERPPEPVRPREAAPPAPLPRAVPAPAPAMHEPPRQSGNSRPGNTQQEGQGRRHEGGN